MTLSVRTYVQTRAENEFCRSMGRNSQGGDSADGEELVLHAPTTCPLDPHDMKKD